MDEVVLRAGLQPVAVLSASFEIGHTMLSSTRAPLKPKEALEVFKEIRGVRQRDGSS